MEVMRFGFSNQGKSVTVNIFKSLTQTHVIFLPTDKHETKLKGVIYFQAIEEVYYDHLRSATKVCLQSPLNVTVFFLIYQFLCHILHVSAHSVLLLLFSLFVLLLWLAAVTEGIFQPQYDQCMYPCSRVHPSKPTESSVSKVFSE